MANRGGPQNPLSVEELTVKFMANADACMATDEARAMAEAIVRWRTGRCARFLPRRDAGAGVET